MKSHGKFKKKGGKKHTSILRKYMESVDKYVKREVGCEEEVEDGSSLGFVKKKSRKELRKEKRKIKKSKLRNLDRKNILKPGVSKVAVPIEQTRQPQKQKEESKEKCIKDSTQILQVNPIETVEQRAEHSETQQTPKKRKKKNKLQESRKKALLQANVEEDREIKKLERYLGFNKRKNKKNLPQSFVADGLDYILGVLDPGSLASNVYDSEDDVDFAKQNFEKLDNSDSEISKEEEMETSDNCTGESSEDVSDEEEFDTIAEMSVRSDNEQEEDDIEEEGESDAAEAIQDATNEEMNESHTGTAGSKQTDTALTGKYVPPHLRHYGDDKRKAELERLKRNVKGLMNRLSEPNMASISNQLEELYMSSSRKDMNDTLTDVILAACVTPALMSDRLLMEHVLLISVLHHTVGLEVGAHFLETVVKRFDQLYKAPEEGKECDNLMAIVAHLYNFQVVHSVLIVDILKMLVGTFAEKDIELVLFILKTVGFALRKDDAMALKELISDAQRKANDVGGKFKDQTRVRFMVETMLALKNNDMRKIPGYDPEPVEKLKKLQRTLIHQSAGGADVKLRVSLENVLAAEQVGRWWIVGSAWRGAPMIGDQCSETSKQTPTEGKFSSKVLDQARKQRMNTDVRRNIFCVIMTSEDYLDAFEKLIRMGLKDQQEREIIHVLMDCCLQEKTFNAFYAVLGEKFCSHHRRFQMTLQFSLWDKFKDLSSLPNSSFNNLVNLVIRLLHKKCLSLSLLKTIEFGELDKLKVRFLRQVLTKLLKETEPEDLDNIFGRISGIPKLGMLRDGLKLFISHFLLKNAQSQGPAEHAALLLERAQVATAAMEAKEAKLQM